MSVIIGINGPSGSGKTTLSKKLIDALKRENTVYISQDSYYNNINHLSKYAREYQNFDHPDSLDLALLESHIVALKNGKNIEQPIYNFKLHSRLPETNKIFPKKFIIVEGTLILNRKSLRPLFDHTIYVDLDQQTCLKRRINRDIKERGRSKKSVIKQYIDTVKPMFEEFIYPSKELSNVIVSGRNNVYDVKKIIKLFQLK